MSEPALQKDQDRKAATRLRKDLFAVCPDAGTLLAGHVASEAAALGLDGASKTVSVFWSMGTEIDTRPLLRTLGELGHVAALPVVAARAQPLVFRVWAPGDSLVDGGFGTSVPSPSADEADPDVLFVPLLAFDDAGYRLGYGGGFYDRTLEKLRLVNAGVSAIGIAFSGQQVDTVTRGPFDQRLDGVVTENGFMRFGARKTR